MTKVSWKPGTMLFPLPPVMVTCGTIAKPNVFTVAWTGIVNSEPPLTYISVRPSRHSHQIISESKEFVINLTNLPLARACDYCGVRSGANTDKFKDMNLAIEPSLKVSAPQLQAAPVSLECKVLDTQMFDTHEMFLAEIVNVNIDDKYLEEDGRLAVEKMGLVAFAHGRYYTMGRDLGAFGFSVDKTKENKTKPRKSKFMEILKIEEKIKEGTLKIKEKKPSLQQALADKAAHSDHKNKNRANRQKGNRGAQFLRKGRGFVGGRKHKPQTKAPAKAKPQS
ncbi:MAG: flavin reductase family protein [Alphaproteobacteria bacterium]|nr:flavin reductase family protein [Alphaproteobacteria bacterium]